MEYIRLTKEQTYYLEKCYSYIVRTHNRARVYQSSITINGDKYSTGYLKTRITNILTEKYYHLSDRHMLNGLKDYYIESKFNEKQYRVYEQGPKKKVY